MIIYRRHFSFVEYIDIINRWSHSFDNLLLKLDVSLPLVTREFPQKTVHVVTSVTYKLLNITILRQPVLINTKNYY